MPFYKTSGGGNGGGEGGGSYDDTAIRNKLNVLDDEIDEINETLNQINTINDKINEIEELYALKEDIDPDIEEKLLNGNTLTLGIEPYQKVDIVDGTTIKLPTVDKYREIHLFFTTTSDITIIMPNGLLYQKVPDIKANKTYEFIFTYTNTDIGWIFGYVEYAE